MSGKSPSAGADDATQAYLHEQARMARAQLRQAETGAGGNGEIRAAHPLEFDARGFPGPESHRDEFIERIRRLLGSPQ